MISEITGQLCFSDKHHGCRDQSIRGSNVEDIYEYIVHDLLTKRQKARNEPLLTDKHASNWNFKKENEDSDN